MPNLIIYPQNGPTSLLVKNNALAIDYRCCCMSNSCGNLVVNLTRAGITTTVTLAAIMNHQCDGYNIKYNVMRYRGLLDAGCNGPNNNGQRIIEVDITNDQPYITEARIYEGNITFGKVAKYKYINDEPPIRAMKNNGSTIDGLATGYISDYTKYFIRRRPSYNLVFISAQSGMICEDYSQLEIEVIWPSSCMAYRSFINGRERNIDQCTVSISRTNTNPLELGGFFGGGSPPWFTYDDLKTLDPTMYRWDTLEDLVDELIDLMNKNFTMYYSIGNYGLYYGGYSAFSNYSRQSGIKVACNDYYFDTDHSGERFLPENEAGMVIGYNYRNDGLGNFATIGLNVGATIYTHYPYSYDITQTAINRIAWNNSAINFNNYEEVELKQLAAKKTRCINLSGVVDPSGTCNGQCFSYIEKYNEVGSLTDNLNAGNAWPYGRVYSESDFLPTGLADGTYTLNMPSYSKQFALRVYPYSGSLSNIVLIQESGTESTDFITGTATVEISTPENS
jgi:hypothetical protein